ncbi:phage tail tape measure protein [Nocardia puris]|uniref:Minor tail protein n=1 Tax=Nocardia puris TaxID=208602 RepID=A0A366CWN1_9NOCA|nr:phage tail tape measure protein [Nocardia puris]RBO82066.1 minor tail protein [Nocardia puris]
MAVELATQYVSLTVETSGLARDAARAFGLVADDARRQLRRAWGQSAEDMRRAFQTGASQTWQNLGQDARREFARSWDQSADDMRQAMQRGASQAAGAAADDMRRDFGQAWGRSANDMRDAFRQAAQQAGNDMQDAMGQAGQQGGGAAGDAAGQGFADRIGGKGGPIAQAIIGAVTIAGIAAGGLLVKSMADAMGRERALDLTQAQLGVDDATMRRIGGAAARAYTDAFGESVEENVDTARRAIQSGLIDPHATGPEIQQVISQLNGVSDMLGEEVPAVARAAGQAIRTGMAQDAKGAMDLFAAAARNGLNVSEDFTDTIVEYGTQFRQLGLTGPEAIGLINQAVRAGARDVDTAADALKEFAIRTMDGSDSSRKAFEALSLSADDMTARFTAGGGTAREAVGELFDALRRLEDPVKRNEVAVALFGTKFEDLGRAFEAFDVDTAVAGLGQVEGAAASAIATMGGNAATSLESAKRSMEVTLQELGGALAQAFGPSLAKLADWVSTHQPEILGFLGKLVDAAFVAGDAMFAFTSTSLRQFAAFAEGVGGALGSVLDPMGKVAEVFGRLTGNDTVANLGRSLQDLDTTFQGAADRARDMADGIDNRARPAWERMRQSVGDSIGQAVQAQQMFRALGDEVEAVPTDKGIRVNTNSPEVIANLEALGLKVSTLPDGQIEVTANTAQGQATLDAFIQSNWGKQIPVEIMASLSAQSRALNDQVQRSGQQTYSQGYVSYADGGIREPQISSGIPGGILWAEAGPEAYISLSPSKRARSIPIWMEVGQRLGLIAAMANGGVVDRAKAMASGAAGSPYQYGGVGNPSWDCSGIQSDLFAILTGRPTGVRHFTTESDFEALGFLPGIGGEGDYSIGVMRGGGGPNSHMAGTLPGGMNVESSGTDGVEAGAGAQGAADFPLKWHLPLGGDPGGMQSPGGGAPSVGSLGGSGLGGGSAPGGGGAAGGGGGYGGGQIPQGVTPVWVVNLGGTSQLEAVPPETNAQASPGVPAVAQQEDWGARAAGIGSDFLNANVDSLLGDLGLRRQGGAVQALVAQVFDAVTKAISAEMAAQQRKQAVGVSRYAGRPV